MILMLVTRCHMLLPMVVTQASGIEQEAGGSLSLGTNGVVARRRSMLPNVTKPPQLRDALQACFVGLVSHAEALAWDAGLLW